MIAERVVASGERMVVVADDEAALVRLDEALWSFRADSFVPHGRSGDQPVFLTGANSLPVDGYANIALADGIWLDKAHSYERTFFFFSAESIEGARAAWVALRSVDGIERHYWKQNEVGRWAEEA